MRLLRSFPAALALALAALAAPVQAETTPEAVWDMVQTRVADAGGKLTASTRQRSDGLVLAGGRVTLRSGAVIKLPDVALRDMGDGSVVLTLPPRFPLVVDLPSRPGQPGRIAVQVAVVDLFAEFRDIGPEAVVATLAATSITLTPDPTDETARALARAGTDATRAQLALAGALSFAGPHPDGTVTVELVGIGALMDGLAAIGALSEDDLLGVRMALAATTRPGAGPDQAVSQIAFRADGGLVVNGMQLR